VAGQSLKTFCNKLFIP